MQTFAVGSQDFSFIRKHHAFYADRTSFIAQWYQSLQAVTLITRPRRFGKTLTLDMVRSFFSVEYQGRQDLFDGLAISSDQAMMQHQGTVPVIFLSFANMHPGSFNHFMLHLRNTIADVYSRHRYLLDSAALSDLDRTLFQWRSDKTVITPQAPGPGETPSQAFLQFQMSMVDAVRDLSMWMERHYQKKVFILVDEYDTPLQEAYMHGFWQEAMHVMRELYGATLKTNPAMDRALLTGITRVAKESLFSDLNNLTVASVLTPMYEQTFGFTEEEVHQILAENGLLDKEDEIRTWYDGFTFGRRSDMYDPWSVSNYLSDVSHEPRMYWTESGGLGLIDQLMRHGQPSLLQNLQSLLLGRPIQCSLAEELVFTELDTNPSAVWSLLLATGYVRLASETEKAKLAGSIDADAHILTLTNREAQIAFERMARKWVNGDEENLLEQFLSALTSRDLERMNRALQAIVLYCSSIFDVGVRPGKGHRTTQPERYLQGLMTGLVTGLSPRFSLSTNRESGFGRYDLALEPKTAVDDVYLFEFKVHAKGDQTLDDTVKRALQQIEEQCYDAAFLQKGYPINRIHKYGIGFKGKKVKIGT